MRLAAIAAIFWTPASFNGQKLAHLDFIRIKKFPMDGLGLKNQIIEREVKKGLHFLGGPVMANHLSGHIYLFCD